jgi:hypothetical protein
VKKIIILIIIFLQSFSHNIYAQTYVGSGSVTQGTVASIITNLYPGCAGSRVSSVGTITSTDSKTWTVPAQTNYTVGPFLPDLYNQCSNVMPANLSAVNLNSLPVKVIDIGGDTITGYIFGDNYYELYINGVLVGVDPVPYTPFNSSVVKFKVSRPYTIAVKLVDWEENLGVGSELNNSNPYHAGDGGFIAQFSDGTVTDSSWRAQTFYIAPIENLSTVIELPDSTRSSSTANTSPSCNANCYGIHYPISTAWNTPAFNDSKWPHATLYTAATVGVNFPAYMNFTSSWNNAKFIWSSNLILDNLVLVRKTVSIGAGIKENQSNNSFNIINPFTDKIKFSSSSSKLENAVFTLFDISGRQLKRWNNLTTEINEPVELSINFPLTDGLYFIRIQSGGLYYTAKLIHN